MKDPIQVPGARQLLKMDSYRAGELMRKLSLSQQRELVLELEPGRRRQDLILMSDRPEALTRVLPPEDLALTIKEIGDQDALSLVEMSSNDQLTFLLDLDLWVKDDLDMQQVDHWLTLLLECGPERTLRWAEHADFELLVLLFERWCLLLDREAIEGLPESVADRVVSPDNYHFIVVKVGADLILMRQVIDLLFGQSQELFLAITGNLGTIPTAEIEELTLRWRTGRLADRGWPDLEEAQAFYQPLAKERLPADAENLPPCLDNAPRYPLQRAWAGRLFPEGLAAVTDPLVRERLASQVANLINRVIVAGGRLSGELESLEIAGREVAGRLEIGLSELGAGDAAEVARILALTPLLHVVQVAQHAIVQRRRRVLRLLHASTGGLLPLMAPPLPGRLRTLARNRPAFLPAEGEMPREFASPADLLALDRDLDLAEAALLLAQKLGLSMAALPDPFPEGSHPESVEGLSLQSLLLTAFARSLLDIPGPSGPVPVGRLGELFEAMETSANGLRDQFTLWADGLLASRPPGLAALLRSLSGIAVEQLLIHDPEGLDPRFVEGLWILGNSDHTDYSDYSA